MADQTPAGASAPAGPAVAWLERGYNRPGAFRQPHSAYYAPVGLFQIHDDHPDDCRCEADIVVGKRSPR